MLLKRDLPRLLQVETFRKRFITKEFDPKQILIHTPYLYFFIFSLADNIFIDKVIEVNP